MLTFDDKLLLKRRVNHIHQMGTGSPIVTHNMVDEGDEILELLRRNR